MLDHEPTGGEGTGAEPINSAADNNTTPTRRARRRPTKGGGERAQAATAEGGQAAPDQSTVEVPAAIQEPPRARRTRKAAKKAVTEEVGEPAPISVEPGESTAGPGTRGRRRKIAPAGTAPTAAVEPTGSGSAASPEGEPAASREAEPTVGPEAELAPTEPPPTEPTARRKRSRSESVGRRPPSSERVGGRATSRAVPTVGQAPSGTAPAEQEPSGPAPTVVTESTRRGARDASPSTAVIFMAPTEAAPPGVPVVDDVESEATPSRRRRGRRAPEPAPAEPTPVVTTEPEVDEDEIDETGHRRRRRGRRGRGRGKGTFEEDVETPAEAGAEPEEQGDEGDEGDEEPMTRRRRRRRRGPGGAGEATSEDGVLTVLKIREPRTSRDEIQGVTGSTRLEAKRQRRRDGRDQRRTRPAILSESEFLARREAVDRVMVVRQSGPAGRPNDRTQIAVLEDGILVEHYVTRQSASSMVGNVYLGKVQNVLPSMEAAFVDIGRGRNAVLYAGEVNWDATGLEGKSRSIEQALKSGESVLVQVTKDPVGHKGARLTSHVALSGRHLVYVPNGHASGISRKLSDAERRRLRDILKNLVPDGAGVIVRTAAEGAAEDDLARDVKRLQAQWDDIQAKAAEGGAPVLLYSEPDLVIRVVRDMFNEDFRELVIQGSEAYDEVEAYLSHVSPDLVSRVRRHTGKGDLFAESRVDEQILKGLDRKVYLPSGGHLVIDRTEAMTVIDVNTGKYTGAGGNLEETVTRNNLEAAEEIVRQLRLRDLGGIVVIDFIDMVLESNRELVLRRLTECLGRDRTKHQVTEITSLGLVQMTRKRIGQGLLEAFSEVCDTCKGRGVIIQTEPVSDKPRNIVAEKVKAVAASSRGVTTAEDEAPVDVSEALMSDRDETGSQFGLDEEISGEIVALDSDEDLQEAGTPARRRTRRGSSRRRTRP
jgi:ribonuclease E